MKMLLKNRSLLYGLAGAALLLLFAGCKPAPPDPETAPEGEIPGATIYGLEHTFHVSGSTVDQSRYAITRRSSKRPAEVLSTVPVIGLPVSASDGLPVSLAGLDFGPDGQLYTHTWEGALISINPTTGQAQRVGPGQRDGSAHGWSYEPTSRRIVMTEWEPNAYRIDPTNGLSTQVPAPLDPSDDTRRITALAFEATSTGASAGYGIDTMDTYTENVHAAYLVRVDPSSLQTSLVGELTGFKDSPSQHARMDLGSDGTLWVFSNSWLHFVDKTSGSSRSAGQMSLRQEEIPQGWSRDEDDHAVAPAGRVRFSADTAAVTEGDTADVAVVREGGSSGPVTVSYTVGGGTASPGGDYAPTSGTVTFGDGETRKSILVPTTEDTTQEGPETFQVRLTDPSSALAAPTTATVTIADDDAPPPDFGGGGGGYSPPPSSSSPTVAFSTSAAHGAAGEGNFTVGLEVRRTGDTSGTTTVSYSVTGGSATAGADYNLPSGTLTFNPGDTTKFVPWQILDDSTAESTETVQITLANPTGGSLGSPSVANVSIIDDDGGAGSTSANWTQVCTAYPAANFCDPAARADAAFADSPGLHGAVLFGGRHASTDYLNDTWLFDGSWHLLDPGGAPCAPPTACSVERPEERTSPSMAYSPGDSALIMFGGRGESPPGTVFGDTWMFSSSGWHRVAESGCTGCPAPRYGAHLTRNPTTGSVVLFGGFSASGAYLNDTWEWNPTTDEWVLQPLTTSPPARANGMMSWDGGSLVVLHGGYSTTGTTLNVLADTWIWDGTTWTQHTSSSSTPGARYEAAMSWSPAAQAVVLFGGDSSTQQDLADTWHWTTASGWQLQSPANSPEGRSNAMLSEYTSPAVDPDKAVLFGGVIGTATRDDTWIYP